MSSARENKGADTSIAQDLVNLSRATGRGAPAQAKAILTALRNANDESSITNMRAYVETAQKLFAEISNNSSVALVPQIIKKLQAQLSAMERSEKLSAFVYAMYPRDAVVASLKAIKADLETKEPPEETVPLKGPVNTFLENEKNYDPYDFFDQTMVLRHELTGNASYTNKKIYFAFKEAAEALLKIDRRKQDILDAAYSDFKKTLPGQCVDLKKKLTCFNLDKERKSLEKYSECVKTQTAALDKMLDNLEAAQKALKALSECKAVESTQTIEDNQIPGYDPRPIIRYMKIEVKQIGDAVATMRVALQQSTAMFTKKDSAVKEKQQYLAELQKSFAQQQSEPDLVFLKRVAEQLTKLKAGLSADELQRFKQLDLREK